ncbi:MAG: polynucleotide adenylyltransferase PcnB [Spirochaetaceae bacterium]|nr:polynucleotide adenylyltransferase PcnB [Spirochaetaceae bacterium]
MRIRYGKEQNGKLIRKAVVYTRDEHRIDFTGVDRDAVFITSRLGANGYESYIVGGAVRDLILGKRPKDFDIVTGATPAQIKRIFRNSRIIGRRFRLVHVFFGPKIFEVSTFRSLKDGHTSNTYGTIEEDVQRRDFSFNALFYDPGKQVVVDYVNGMADIKKRILRPIIPVELIFKDDPVRMIRAVKYAAAGGFKIPWLLQRRIKKEAPLLKEISASRLTEELSKIIRSPYAARIVEALEDAGLYGYLQKEASALLKTDAGFRSKYFRSLADSSGEPGEGKALAALIQDYLELKTPWQELKQWEDYQAVFFDARRFLLPMNPPRLELDRSIRRIFAAHGIELKKKALFERDRRTGEGSRRSRGKEGSPVKEQAPPAAAPAGQAGVPGQAGTRPLRRRRRQKSPAPRGL